MAYLLTAVMTGGVAALLSVHAGETVGNIFVNYIIYGHLGMATLAAAMITARIFDRTEQSAD